MASPRTSPGGTAGGTPGGSLACGLLFAALLGCATEPAPPQPPEAASLAALAPAALALAERASFEERHADAQVLLERARLLAPGDARVDLGLAEQQLADGAVEAAADAFLALSRVPGLQARALQGAGLALVLQGDCARALGSLRQAVALEPDLWRAWNALGSCYDLDGDWWLAGAAYSNALAANPGAPIVHNNRGFSRLLQGRFQEAAEDLERALALDPALAVARRNLRLVLAWQGRYQAALAGLAGRELSEGLNEVGFVALLRGDYGAAELHLLRALQSDPRFNPVAAANLGYLERVRAGDRAEHAAAASNRAR